MLLLPRPDGGRQDGSGAAVGRIPLRLGEVIGSLRYVGVHGKAFRLEVDRGASRVCRLRRRRPIDGTRAPDTVLGDSARRNRKGASGCLQYIVAGV